MLKTLNQSIDEILPTGDFVVLDTETTGIRPPLEVVQIAIVDGKTGATLLDEYVRTSKPIPAIATGIHGITNEMVARAPAWAAVRLSVHDILRDRVCVVYNADYDIMVLEQSDLAAGLAKYQYNELADWRCAMLWYADIWGEWDVYHGNNRWQRLSSALAQQGLVKPIDAHSALADCQSTLKLIRRVLEKRQGAK